MLFNEENKLRVSWFLRSLQEVCTSAMNIEKNDWNFYKKRMKQFR